MNTHKKIEELAYFIWLIIGKPHGRDIDIWLTAEGIQKRVDRFQSSKLSYTKDTSWRD